jgi:hypothetical protein
MANNPKKVKDPTEVALSAIQEALNISDTAVSDNARSSMHAEAASTNSSAIPDFNESSFDIREPAFDTRPGNDRPIFEPIEEPRSTRRAANDDRETIGQILQAIQKGRPARNVYTLATLFTAVWLISAGVLTFSFLPSLQAAIGQGAGGTLALAGLAALFLAPVLLFYFMARSGIADDRAVDGAGRDPFFGARGRSQRFDGDGRPGDPPRSRRDGRRR